MQGLRNLLNRLGSRVRGSRPAAGPSGLIARGGPLDFPEDPAPSLDQQGGDQVVRNLQPPPFEM